MAEPSAAAPTPTTPKRPLRVRRRRSWAAGGLLVAAAILIWFAPAIVASTPLAQYFLAQATADVAGTLRAGSLSLGWLSPVVAREVVLLNPEGEPVAEVERLATERSLLALLTDRKELGEIRVVEPTVRIVLREDDTNVDELVESFLKRPRPPRFELELDVQVAGGQLIVEDAVENRQWTFTNVELSFIAPADPSKTMQLAANARLAGEEPGVVRCAASLPRETQPGALQAAEEVRLEVDALPLELFEPLLRREVPGLQLAGTLNADLQSEARPTEGPGPVSLVGHASARDLAVQLPAWQEPLRLASLRVPIDARLQGEQIAIDRLAVESDVGQAELRGTLPVGQLRAGDWEALTTRPWQTAGQLDLAKVVRLMPETFQVRDGTEIRSGELEWQLASQAIDGGFRWRGQVTTSRLTAEYEGRTIAWEEPLMAEILARWSAENLVVEELEARSTFLRLTGSGTLDRFAATAEFDLNRLETELRKFFDLGTARLAGEGSAQLNWDTDADRQFDMTAEARLQNFEWTIDERHPWTERELTANISASGLIDGTSLERVEQAAARMVSGAGEATVRLTAPVENPREEAAWPLRVDAQGQLAAWSQRLRPFLGDAELDVAGQFNLAAEVVVSPEATVVRQAQLRAEQLRVAGPNVRIEEPQMQAALDATWQGGPGRLAVERASVQMPALQVQTDDFVYERAPGAMPRIEGSIAYQGDLGRLAGWFRNATLPPRIRWDGQVRGTLRGEATGSIGRLVLDLGIDNLAVWRADAGAAQQEPLWREPRVTFVADLVHDREARLLRLNQLNLASGALQLSGRGQVSKLTTDQLLDVEGQIEYDLARLSRLLQPYWGEDLVLIGRQQRPFHLAGPLGAVPEEHRQAGGEVEPWRYLVGEASFGWDRAELFGLEVGRGAFEATMSGGLVRFRPIDVVVSQGRVLLSPAIRLTPGPAAVLFEEGPVIQRVALTPEICESAVKYAAPVLTGATVARGELSLALEGGELPLAAPGSGELAGQLMIHAAEVRPGPVAEELVWLVRQLENALRRQPLDAVDQAAREPLLTITDNNVDFRLTDRRVFHQGLQVQIREVTISTFGSVGLDQTLALMAQIPIRAEWFQRFPRLARMRDQVLRVPIDGTLSRPRVQRDAWREIVGQFFLGAGEELLRGAIQRGLERLLEPGEREQEQ